MAHYTCFDVVPLTDEVHPYLPSITSLYTLYIANKPKIRRAERKRGGVSHSRNSSNAMLTRSSTHHDHMDGDWKIPHVSIKTCLRGSLRCWQLHSHFASLPQTMFPRHPQGPRTPLSTLDRVLQTLGLFSSSWAPCPSTQQPCPFRTRSSLLP